MYIPPHFAVNDPTILFEFIEKNGFGLLASCAENEPFATHLPFLLDRQSGSHGALLGHVARANPHWKRWSDRPALAIFSGPHAYVSPSWYESTNVVPTWNYAAVHVYGSVQTVEEAEPLREIVARTVDYYESTMPRPWKLPDESIYLDRMLSQIVGFRIEIERLEGKWKLSQNHPEERRLKVIDELEKQGDENSNAIATMMRRMGRELR